MISMIADCCDQGEKRPAYDKCTLLKWFISMDTDMSGEISKDEFVAFLRKNAHLQTMMLGQLKDTTSDGICESLTPRRARRSREALGVKRMVKLFKEIDENRNGQMDFEEFVEFFRQAGFLLEYRTPDNPRNREEEMLAKEHSRRVSLNGTATTDMSTSDRESFEEEMPIPVSARWARVQSERSWASEQLKELRAGCGEDANPRRRKSDSSLLQPDLCPPDQCQHGHQQRRRSAAIMPSSLEPWSISRHVDVHRPPPLSTCGFSSERFWPRDECPLRFSAPSLRTPRDLVSNIPQTSPTQASYMQMSAEDGADVLPRESCRPPTRHRGSRGSPRKSQRSQSKSPQKFSRMSGRKSPGKSPRKRVGGLALAAVAS